MGITGKPYRLSKRSWALLFAWAVFASLPAGSAPADPKPDEQVQFKATEDSKGKKVGLKLHVFKPEGWSEDDQRPAVVFFFGGGWVGVSRIVEYEGVGRGFFNAGGFGPLKDDQPNCHKITMREVTALLEKHGYLKPVEEAGQ